MAELNMTYVTDEQWQAFLKDITDVQEKHGLVLVPTFKLNAIQGVTYEWGAMRKTKKEDEVPKTKSKSSKGDSNSKE